MVAFRADNTEFMHYFGSCQRPLEISLQTTVFLRWSSVTVWWTIFIACESTTSTVIYLTGVNCEGPKFTWGYDVSINLYLANAFWLVNLIHTHAPVTMLSP